MTGIEIDNPALEHAERKNAGNRLFVPLIYLIVGPPIGGVYVTAFYTGFGMFAALGDPEGFGSVSSISLAAVSALPWVMAMSYFFGGVQALSTGVLIALFAEPDSRFSYGTAIFTAAVVSVIVGAIMTIAWTADFLWLAVILGIISILSSLTLRLLFRGMFAPPRQ